MILKLKDKISHKKIYHRILDQVNHQEWDSLLKKSKDVNFFQTARYLQQQYSNERFPLFVYFIDESNEIVGQIGLTVIKKVDINISRYLRLR